MKSISIIVPVYNEELSINSSKKLISILQVLNEEGYIQSYEVSEGIKPIVTIKLKYYEGKPVIEKISRVSKPGIRIYKSAEEIPVVNNGLGICIVSTSKGVMTDKQARKNNCGGEIICYVS